MVLTQTFLDEVRDQVKQQISDDFLYVAVGTDNTTPSSSDTSLGNEVLRKARQETTSGTDYRIVSMWVNSTEANGNSLKEVGTFNQSSGGSMWTRNTFTSLSKTDSMEVWIDVKVTISVSEV